MSLAWKGRTISVMLCALRMEMHASKFTAWGTYSDSTLHTYWQFINELKKEGKSLALLTMEAEVKAYGYEGLDAAEKALSK